MGYYKKTPSQNRLIPPAPEGAGGGGGDPEPPAESAPPFRMINMDDMVWKTRILDNTLTVLDVTNKNFIPHNPPTTDYHSIKLSDAASDSFLNTGIDIGNTTDTTISIWVKPLTTSGTNFLMSTDEGGYDWHVGWDGSNWRITNGGGYHNTGDTVVQDQWYHVAVVFDTGASTLYFYLDGVETYTKSISTDANTGPWWIGRSPGYTNNRCDAEIVSASIWDKALAADEIADIHAGGYMFDITTDSGNYVSSSDTLYYLRRAMRMYRFYLKDPDTGIETPFGAGGPPQGLEKIVETQPSFMAPSVSTGLTFPS